MPPSGDGWIHEIKHDGYRRGGRIRLFARRGFDWTSRFPWIVESAARLKGPVGHVGRRGVLFR
jgi:ATP-dependent DNA ligase